MRCVMPTGSQPHTDHLVGAHVVPLVEGKRRALDRRDVCPGGPTGQGPIPWSARSPEPVVGVHLRRSTTVDNTLWTVNGSRKLISWRQLKIDHLGLIVRR